jgi:hypothetical protein
MRLGRTLKGLHYRRCAEAVLAALIQKCIERDEDRSCGRL